MYVALPLSHRKAEVRPCDPREAFVVPLYAAVSENPRLGTKCEYNIK